MAIRYEPCPRCRRNGRDNKGDNLVMFSDNDGHCFSCGFHVFPKHYVSREVVSNVPKSLRPSDFTREVPIHALTWLLQYGLPWSHWKDSIGYSEKEQRLVFELSYEGALAFSIGRYLPAVAPAVNTPLQPAGGDSLHGTRTPRKWYVWGDSHKHCHVLPGTNQTECNPIVLVEDLISANKIAVAGFTSLPLFGVEIHPCHLYYLYNSKQPVVLWLDKDQEQQSRRKALRLESLISRSVRTITTDNDPKLLAFKEIYETIRSTQE